MSHNIKNNPTILNVKINDTNIQMINAKNAKNAKNTFILF